MFTLAACRHVSAGANGVQLSSKTINKDKNLKSLVTKSGISSDKYYCFNTIQSSPTMYDETTPLMHNTRDYNISDGVSCLAEKCKKLAPLMNSGASIPLVLKTPVLFPFVLNKDIGTGNGDGYFALEPSEQSSLFTTDAKLVKQDTRLVLSAVTSLAASTTECWSVVFSANNMDKWNEYSCGMFINKHNRNNISTAKELATFSIE